ncbi:Rab3 GTPase-activating protein catalytic subunit [Chytridiales sp. JEL 0842]|nr:Rab3 GTPase-activating protein catalytic subunit [Chytridiales sp. JEL 0842]
MGASILLEGIERVIQEEGSTPAAKFARDGEWESMAISNEDEAEGGLRPLELKLLKTGQVMMEPEVQEPGVWTEDMLLEQELVFERLGTSEEAAKIRARMQCAQLISDMESFKAANPHAMLEDFVRWHSPRDWIEDEHGGHLSSRMMEPDNLWQELWKSARRVPAKRQKPLFNDEKEAEKALLFLENQGPCEILSFLIPTMFFIAYNTICSHAITQHTPSLGSAVIKLGAKLGRLRWNQPESIESIKQIITDIQQIESQAGLSMSLLQKLPMQFGLVDTLLAQHGEAQVLDGTEKDAVWELMMEGARGNSPMPSKREFMFKTKWRLPSTSSRLVPQRMYAQLQKDGELRLMEMVGRDMQNL